MTYMTIEQFRQIYDEWKQSGLSVQQYCENTGLSESRFYYWKAKLKAEMLPAACGSFIPVKMSGKPASYSARGARTSALCEVEYPNGVIVRVTSDMTLDQLRQDRGNRSLSCSPAPAPVGMGTCHGPPTPRISGVPHKKDRQTQFI